MWDESFEVMVPSRVAAKFNFEIMDWDRVGTATPLGSGPVDLAALEPFEVTEWELPVVPPKGGKDGSVQLRLLFQPESKCSHFWFRWSFLTASAFCVVWTKAVQCPVIRAHA